MNKIINNFKQMNAMRIIMLVCALVMIIGTFIQYVSIEGTLEYSLFKAFPIGGAIIILSGLLVIVGVGIANKIVSLIGSCLALLGNIVFIFIIRTETFYYKLSGLGELGEAAKGATESLDQALGTDVTDSVTEVIKESFKFETGFYLILGAALIATIVIIIDMIQVKKNIDTSKINSKARGMMDSISNSADQFKASSKYKSLPWVCEACEEENDAKSKFCVYCGAAKPKPKTCYKCGTYLEEHMKFCPRCGTEYDKEKSKARFEEMLVEDGVQVCKKCGAELPEGATFCGKCGTKQ